MLEEQTKIYWLFLDERSFGNSAPSAFAFLAQRLTFSYRYVEDHVWELFLVICVDSMLFY